MKIALVACLAMVIVTSSWGGELAQSTGNERVAIDGDAPTDPGPLATLSPDLKPEAIQSAMRRVADWQSARIADTPSQDWTYATLYVGLLSASETLQKPRYRDLVLHVAEHYKWTLGSRQTHADDQAIGQSYLWLYHQSPSPERIQPLKTQFDSIMQLPDDPAKPVWWWCDALFMAPPVWSGLASVTHDAKYVGYMNHEWKVTSNLLWDPQERLFFRDKNYFDKHEKNGRKVFWSRGNGWVMGGLAPFIWRSSNRWRTRWRRYKVQMGYGEQDCSMPMTIAIRKFPVRRFLSMRWRGGLITMFSMQNDSVQ